MGGLVARSAYRYAAAAGYGWPRYLRFESPSGRPERPNQAEGRSQKEQNPAAGFGTTIKCMRFCRTTVVYVMCFGVCAAPGYSLQQTKSFIHTSFQPDNPDKKAVETLDKMKLSEYPDPAALQALPVPGAGPQTAVVPEELATESAALPEGQPPAPKPVHVPPPPPSSEEQAKLLDEVRDYASNYTSRLPDFICLEQTRRYVDTTGRETWMLVDVLTARLSYFNQKEDYKLVSKNGRRVTDVSYAGVGGAFSMGDFGTDMRDIFDPASHATFAWKGWTTLRGRRTHVFSYLVPLEFSKYTIGYKGDQNEPKAQRIKVGYWGSVFVDKELNMIVRITQEARNIPPSYPILQAEETLDYDFTKIGDSQFFLPRAANLKMRSRTVTTKNVKEFRLYRKFSADAVIKFDGQELPPLPDDKTKDQPPK